MRSTRTSPTPTRLALEWLDNDADPENDFTTAYQYNQTQQTASIRYDGPSVASGVIAFRRTFEYNLQGQISSVINSGYDSGGALVSREKTSYEYDSRSFRIESINFTDSALDGNYTLTSRTTFLASAARERSCWSRTSAA